MEYIDKPVCDSCGGLEFKLVEIKKPKPEIRYVQASQHFRSVDYTISESDCNFGKPELTEKAICKKCGREYLY